MIGEAHLFLKKTSVDTQLEGITGKDQIQKLSVLNTLLSNLNYIYKQYAGNVNFQDMYAPINKKINEITRE